MQRIRKRLRAISLIFKVAVFLCVLVGTLLVTWSGEFYVKGLGEDADESLSTTQSNAVAFLRRRRLLVTSGNSALNEQQSNVNNTRNDTADATEIPRQYWPDDLFSLEERRRGFVLLHVSGVAYMFVALAVVCDEFFVPSLNVIAVRLALRKDVAGATFMAAGGSAPELFTSIFGVFVARTNVGFGTIVGSAVFNVLFVIGMCAVVSKKALHLSWWSLLRDCSFYAVALAMLIGFYSDSEIAWFEALLLFLVYVGYVVFMRFNSRAERWVKLKLRRDAVQPIGIDRKKRSLFGKVSHEKDIHDSQVFIKPCGVSRQGAIHLMLYALDPLARASCEDNSRKLQQMASLQPDPHIITATTDPDNAMDSQQQDNLSTQPSHPTPKLSQTSTLTLPGTPFMSEPCDFETMHSLSVSSSDRERRESETSTTQPYSQFTDENKATALASPGVDKSQQDLVRDADRDFCVPQVTVERPSSDSRNCNVSLSSNSHSLSTGSTHADRVERQVEMEEETGSSQEQADGEEDEEEEEPLDISWPKSWRRRITFVLICPILFALYFTLPDVRHERKRKYFIWTFVGSILWIAAFSYFMVWWANQVGETIGISPEVMGLTFLAAGTSIPDLITSVIVARQGHGDMAVSSSVGSNLFDVTLGLPVPWLLAAIIYGQPVQVISKGLFCSISLLFGMLVLFVVSIIVCRWKMNRKLGVILFLEYFIFLAFILLLETEAIGKCIIGT